MGAELISAVLEIRKDATPDWSAAEKHIQEMSDLDAMNIYSDCLGLGEEYTQEDLDDPESDLMQNSHCNPEIVKRNMLQSLDNIKLGWENRLRSMNKIHLKDSIILLAAGTSWGDNVPECDDLFLFAGCGAANAAGFY